MCVRFRYSVVAFASRMRLACFWSFSINIRTRVLVERMLLLVVVVGVGESMRVTSFYLSRYIARAALFRLFSSYFVLHRNQFQGVLNMLQTQTTTNRHN